MDKLVSVIMPCYNTAGFIEATVRSVLLQTYSAWELLIVDDCSSDGTAAVLSPLLSDTRIRYFRNEENCGAAMSRNRALREARGDYIAFLDSDDLWLPEKLERQVAFMEENDYAFSCTESYVCDEDGTRRDYILTAPQKITRKKMYRYCYPAALTVMYRVSTVGLLQIEDIKINNDYALWLLAVEKSPCYLLPIPLAVYRRRGGSLSGGRKIRLAYHHYVLFRQGLHFSPPRALFCTFRNLFFGVLKKLIYKRKITP